MTKTKDAYYIAVFDAEYTALTEKNRGLQEVIQFAIIVMAYNRKTKTLQEVYQVQQFVQPSKHKKLSKHIKRLTKIKQEDIDHGIEFDKFLYDLQSIVDQFKIKRIYTWGPDAILLQKNLIWAHPELLSTATKNLMKMFTDVSLTISRLLHSTNKILPQKEACARFGVEEQGDHHDAYSDAYNLSQLLISLASKS